MILKNLYRRKIRTLLTVLGISVGVAAIIGLGAMADGFETGYSAMLGGSQADFVLSQPDSMDIAYSSVDESVGAELEAMPEVDQVSAMLEGYAQIENEPYFFVFAYPDHSFVLDRFQIIAGIHINDREARSLRGSPILLGSATAEVLNKTVGDSLHLSGSVFRVIGIYQTGSAFEDSAALLRLEDAQRVLNKPRQVSLYYITLKHPDLKDRFITRIERKYTELALSGSQEFADEQLMVEAMQAFVWVIGGFAILIGGVGMMNAQLMAVFERTREIGVLRAVGWSSGRVLRMILGEAISVSLLGGLLGLGFGWLVLYLLSSRTLFLGVISTNLSPQLLAQVGLVVLLLGITGGLYPAWRASRLQPIEALRYEGGSGGKIRRLPLGGMAVQSLWQRLGRTLLTVGAIGLTVGAIISLDSIIQGMSLSMDDMFANTEIMIRQADVSDTSLSAVDERVSDKIQAYSGVHSTSGIIFSAVTIGDGSGFFIVFGMEPNSYAIQRYRIVEGEPLKSNHQVIIGRRMAESLNKSVGSTLELSRTRFRIVGIYESLIGFEEMGGILTLRDAQVLIGRPRKVTMLAVKLKDPALAPALVERINTEYPQVHATLSSDFAEQMPDFEASNAMLGGISVMAILVGGVGILNTMLMSVFERTREIGVLRSLGWRKRRILSLFLQEAIWLGILGGVAGIGAAVGLTILINSLPIYGGMLNPLWDLPIILRALGIALLLGLIGGIYPAYRATRFQPVEALSYE
jgi:ABC-type lipoprotein release transport system permease subunit